ncbi:MULTISPECIES: hypothetical protein [Cyclobacterium]|uniref:DUF4249 family protein n=1 Tax=Cyclobacterium plantarum TaxID=2716263 RepID=A0ABX0H7B8_9BACT|nr:MULTISPECIES: hypothetical protein [Cyclobacterium]MBD3630079.1 hypothetical protein [Cyclobacterium sp.]NHE57673.1 hypothetical protein [Cyclobacterium plantarum]
MKLKNHYIIVLIILSVWGGCISPPDDFPTIPDISFNNMEFVQASGADSLIITLNFRDAEGDLGLNARDLFPPFNELNYLTDDEGNFITYSNRPDDAPSFNNRDWVIFPLINNVEIEDTLWVSENEDYYNIFVKFFIKRGGNYTEFKWSDPPYFTTFNGRFPRMLEEERGRAIEGNIRYSMLSLGWNSIFRTDTLRLELQVQDRALNRSNVVTTPDFTLAQIER